LDGPLKFCGISVKTTLFADQLFGTSDPGSTVSHAKPINPGCGTLDKQE
jgi:hypothetical protein